MQEIAQLRVFMEGKSSSSQTQSEQPPQNAPANTVQTRKLNNPTVRERKREKRIKVKATRLRGSRATEADDEDSEDEELDEDHHLRRLKVRLYSTIASSSLPIFMVQSRIRHTLEDMLQIKDWSIAAVMFPPLTEQQIEAYNRRDGSFVCDPKDFRIDFKHSWKKFPFNKEARAIFIDKYLAHVAGGAFFNNPTPSHLLTRESIGELLDNHMDYCRLRWRHSFTPLSAERLMEIARRAAQNSRKHSVCVLGALAQLDTENLVAS